MLGAWLIFRESTEKSQFVIEFLFISETVVSQPGPPMNKGYENPIILEFRDLQVRYTPKEKKLEQADRTELLLYELNDDSSYTYAFICYRITDFRPELNAEIEMTGKSLKNDLRLLIEDLTRSAAYPFESIKVKAWTLEELAEHFQVSGKTISRWRTKGLVSRIYVIGGRKRVAFLDSSVTEFVKRNPQSIKKGADFKRLDEEEKDSVIIIARRLSNAGANATEVAKRLAEQFGRSAETIRCIIKAFDEENPDIAIFPNRTAPLRKETRTKVFQEYRSGEPVVQLADKYHRTTGSVYRVLAQMRAQRIFDLPLDYIDNPEFYVFRTEGRTVDILEEMPYVQNAGKKSRKKVIPVFEPEEEDEYTGTEDFSQESDEPIEPHDLRGLPPYLSDLYAMPLLTAEQETHLFRKMNYLKYLAAHLRDTLDLENPKTSQMEEIESLYNQAVKTKNDIVTANLRLVVSIAKKHVNVHSQLYELVSDGNLALIRAVEKFDYSRGNKFSTYASWAIMRNFARTIPSEMKYHERFHASGESELFDLRADERSDLHSEERDQLEREVQVDRLLNVLDEREQNILSQRYGLGENRETQSLRQVGDEMGITKERVRQIETRALAKLRKVAEEEHLEIPGLD